MKGLCLGGLFPGVSVQGGLCPVGGLYTKAVSVLGSLSVWGLCPGGLCPGVGGSLSRGGGVSVQGWGGLCPGGSP